MKNKTKMLAIVVVYNPNIYELVDNINQYLDSVDELIIWLNSELDEKQKKYISNNLLCEHFFFAGKSENDGISIALNFATDYAIKNDFCFLLTMDQDSYWENFSLYRSYIEQENHLNTNVGIWGPCVVDKATGLTNREEYPDHVITSGAVYKVKDLKKIGKFNENYFVDAIDEEICLRASMYGISTKRISDASLFQEFGESKKVKLLGKTTTTPNYSAFRYYYIVRNHIWLIKNEYVSKNIKKRMLKSYVINPLVKVLIFEDRKYIKLKRIFKGIIDGLRGEDKIIC